LANTATGAVTAGAVVDDDVYADTTRNTMRRITIIANDAAAPLVMATIAGMLSVKQCNSIAITARKSVRKTYIFCVLRNL